VTQVKLKYLHCVWMLKMWSLSTFVKPLSAYFDPRQLSCHKCYNCLPI
jgi:hypothetical protein